MQIAGVGFGEVFVNESRAPLAKLYENFVDEQWALGKTFEWSNDWPYADPLRMSNFSYEISDEAFWRSLGADDSLTLSRNFQVWRISQMLHAEEAALDYSAKLAILHDDPFAKACCAGQAMDEARHMQVFQRLLSEVGATPFAMSPALKNLLSQVSDDNRISLLSLSMQILVEGVGIGAFRRISIASQSPFVRTLFGYLMKDEARHFALGRITVASQDRIRDEVPRAELEDFLDEALVQLAEYITPTEVLRQQGCGERQLRDLIEGSAFLKHFGRNVFSQIARPILDLGLDVNGRAHRRIIDLAGLAA